MDDDLQIEAQLQRNFHILHCVSKNDSDVAHYNFNAHQLILAIFGRDINERIRY